jgi:hypothetical protein
MAGIESAPVKPGELKIQGGLSRIGGLRHARRRCRHCADTLRRMSLTALETEANR